MKSKHIEIDADTAVSLMGGKKPSAKGKKRRTEIQADTDLEGKMSEHVVKKSKKAEAEPDSKVGAASLRGMMSETIARVYEEIWPGMRVRDGQDEPDREIQEEAYILTLTMLVGNTVDLPRTALKIRESEISKTAKFCRRHAT